jgi:hypothetical protein
MANIFTNINTETLGISVLNAYAAALLPLSAFTLNAGNEPYARGDTVKVLSVGTGSAANDYSTDTGYVMQDTGASSIDVVLDKHKYVTAKLHDSEMRDSALLNIEAFGRAKGEALANSVLTDIMSFLSSSFYEETRSVAKSLAFSASAIVDLSNYADSLNWPASNRSLVLTPTQHSYLRKDTAIQASYAFGSPDIIRKGDVPSLDTFSNIYKTSLVPVGSVGFACQPNALVLASRVVYSQEQNSYNDVKVLTHEDTGLSITQKGYFDPQLGAQCYIWEAEYGYKIGNPEGCFLLV